MAKKKSRKIERGSIKHLRKSHKNLDILLPLFALAILVFLVIKFIQ